ncbi:MAG: DegT/DnrJ/EryC1/StrS family aminotransferase [Thermoguttaceae bacterium]
MSMKVPLLDLKAQYAQVRQAVLPAVESVLESQQFILGPVVEECERQIAEYCGCRFGIGVSSGTDALLIALMAEGIGPGDEVITTPHTFFATAGSVARAGARPVFVDICPKTYNLDPSQIESRITRSTKAILPVHLFGQCAAMDAVLELARAHRLVVIEDAAQAIGAEYKGRRAGSMGHYGCFSFFPSKNLGGGGDGGMVVVQDAERAEKLKVLRVHGSKPKYYHKLIGGNFRFDALQAAIVRAKLPYLDQWTAARQANARRYRELFEQAGLVEKGLVGLPYEAPQRRHIYNQFVIRVPRRDELRRFLAEQGIGTEIYYPVPLHLQECFRYLGYQEGDCPHSEAAARNTLALPIYPELTDQQLQYVVDCIGRFLS